MGDRFRDLGSGLADTIGGQLIKDPKSEEARGFLRMSSIGQPCNRKLWYTINRYSEREPLSPETKLKFLYGHMIEDLVLFLAELAGHSVEGRQDEVEIEGVKGHRDAVIDGVLTDVKSASTFSFKKFQEGKLAGDDPFGYIDQIQSYLYCAQEDPIVTDKDRCAFFVVDKTLGNMCLDFHKRSDFPISKIYQYKKELVSRPEPPSRAFDPIPEGKSGNMKLGMNCSYCDFKKICHPDLRTFLYSGKPVFLTKVVREPNVMEVL